MRIRGIGCLFFMGGLLMAQADEAPLRDAMKQIGPTNGALGKKLAAKDDTAAEDARKLQVLFEGVQKFWEERKSEDAVGFSKSAASQFESVRHFAQSEKWEEAAAAHKKVGAACMGCHGTHREKAPDGSWKIK